MRECVDGLLGRNYELGSRGPETFDCLGFVIYVYSEVFDIYFRYPTLSRRGLEEFSRYFVRVPDMRDLQTGDILHWSTSERLSDQHLALVEDDEWLVECGWPAGVVRNRISRVFNPKWTACRPKALCSDSEE